jgi:hypothetical protein
MYSSTCFGRPHAHHQELNNCRSSLWFYRWSVVVAALLVVVGPTTTNSTATITLQVKPEAATAVVELLMMCVRTPETCWAVHKRQVINLIYLNNSEVQNANEYFSIFNVAVNSDVVSESENCREVSPGALYHRFPRKLTKSSSSGYPPPPPALDTGHPRTAVTVERYHLRAQGSSFLRRLASIKKGSKKIKWWNRQEPKKWCHDNKKWQKVIIPYGSLSAARQRCYLCTGR